MERVQLEQGMERVEAVGQTTVANSPKPLRPPLPTCHTQTKATPPAVSWMVMGVTLLGMGLWLEPWVQKA